jgi:hypothetical protein
MKVVPFSVSAAAAAGEERRWPYKSKTCHPRWYKARDLGTFQGGDSLRITVHLHRPAAATHATSGAAAADSSQSEPVARTDLVLANVTLGVVYTILVPVLPAWGGKIVSSSSGGSGSGSVAQKELPPLVLTLRFIPPRPARKTLFIIRHAQRCWRHVCVCVCERERELFLGRDKRRDRGVK